MRIPSFLKSPVLISVIATGGLLATAWHWQGRWLPAARIWFSGSTAPAAGAKDEHDHAGHEHGQADSSIKISEQARRNIGMTVGEVQPRTYSRSITLPGMVAERPGRTRFRIAAPLTGVVTAVNAVTGESVTSGTLLFTLRLTHEDLVAAQARYLATLGQLDVEVREIARLEGVTSSGAVAGKTLLSRQYEKEKLEAALRAERESLLLHGLTEAQVQQIAKDRRLLREMRVYVPSLHGDDSLHHDAEPEVIHPAAATSEPAEPHAHAQRFVLTELSVQQGQAVNAGDSLCMLADYTELYIEGRAFEQDSGELMRAANENRPVAAVLERGSGQTELIEGLEFSHASNEVETDSRALYFYVRLPNTVVRDAVRSDGRHFLTWRFKPGQRLQVRVPVEAWENVLVVPVEALAQEGAEAYVFVENGASFERRPVHVKYRDQLQAVLANDGSLFPGDAVALSGAHQLQMALRNKSGGAVDPHAGHNH